MSSEKYQPVPNSTIWTLAETTAKLRTSDLCGQVDLRNPLRGLCNLNYRSTALEGSVLGVSIDSVGEDASFEEAFFRGEDLVASYREAGDQPSSLQVDWKITQHESDVVVIDTLLSLETPLLESFPKVLVKSELPGAEVWQPAEDCGYLVLRSVDKNWSFVEMAHPADSGELRIDEKGGVQRTLGGTFLEKGVIHRLRLRGAFLPRENDLQLAAESFAEFATKAPPLTA